MVEGAEGRRHHKQHLLASVDEMAETMLTETSRLFFKKMAKAQKLYYEELIEEGFSSIEATHIVSNFSFTNLFMPFT